MTPPSTTRARRPHSIIAARTLPIPGLWRQAPISGAHGWGWKAAAREWNYSLALGGVEEVQLVQAFVEYAGWKPFDGATLRFRFGAWSPPTGLDDASANTETLFLERAAVADIVRGAAGGDGRVGLGAFAHDDRWHASLVMTGENASSAGAFDDQTGYIARLAVVALQSDRLTIHVGASASGILDVADFNAAATDQMRLRERAELRVDAQRFVDTGAISADALAVRGLELAGAWRNFYAAGEAFRIHLARTDGLQDPTFYGWYLQGAWTLTGENRRWNAFNGSFRGSSPDRPLNPSRAEWGQWEIATRHSVLDLDDNAGAPGAAPPLGGVRGGEQTITTIGVSWRPDLLVRFLFDYQWVEVDRLDPENTSIVTPVPGLGAEIGQAFEALSLRAQVAF